MSSLKIYHADTAQLESESGDFDEIATCLHGIGVRFERWHANRDLGAEASAEEIIGAYRDSVDQLMAEHGFQSADVISLKPDYPDKAALRRKFLDEHTHSDFEVRFFVEGKGLFFIHHVDKVYGIMCTRGDLISVPANTTHWFDMGENPDFKCIRLFSTPEGWVANYTGDAIATRFPRFDDF